MSLPVSAVLLAAAACAPPQPVHPRSPPTAIPQTTLSTLEGDAVDLRHFLHGRPALVSFWATWCEACVNEMPALNRLSAEASQRGGDAVVVGVAIGEPQEKIVDFVAAHHVAFAQLIDEDFRFSDALGERRVPTTLVVDRAAGIVFRGASLDSSSLDAFRRVAAVK